MGEEGSLVWDCLKWLKDCTQRPNIKAGLSIMKWEAFEEAWKWDDLVETCNKGSNRYKNATEWGVPGGFLQRMQKELTSFKKQLKEKKRAAKQLTSLHQQ